MKRCDFLDRILKGVHAADLAIEQTSDVELTINLKTCRTLGLTIPAALLVPADRVLE